jgi:NADH:ubiquinone oxidoreductase subunit 4 (subunit M)
VLTAAITATYLLRMFSQAFFGELNPRWSGLREISWPERAGAAVLAASIVTLGVWPAPWIDRISTALEVGIPGVDL